MTAMDDLAKWLREQIAEDEEAARKATLRTMADTDQWHADWSAGMQIRDGKGHLIVKHSWPNEIEHIVRHDPRAVLAQCEAHRRIIDACAPLVDPDGPYYDDDDSKTGVNLAEDAVLPALALAYQHRPGYRSEWRA